MSVLLFFYRKKKEKKMKEKLVGRSTLCKSSISAHHEERRPCRGDAKAKQGKDLSR
ncbi:hypothetical protein AMELA_G00175120 [Ameiurus melas]|uniref:Uncharacterized protein n=1 Tax=Ameiurus melas TaxID=219545 RepID=A0A7J6ACW1_AMEME|nr:hypothetical protein AMELA_G00175120 [Ameiurus melas]